ncbi:hypothetical protein [Tautonia plasticadhaerens]|uniref:Uncharacterized protein n=1 Tax=Tautonia plasticadhaerens TaxID=2527974 RepID=A0A518HBQ9_9BACT|nr:hypothetical protein [Tautonia plasticadhaerens]QDV38279.1 hypothetical protein ElP_62300 [Tautonia plasticadhaerens]
MNLVRFGSIYVNFDRISTIRDLTPDPGDGPRLVRIEFGQGHSIDVTANAQRLLDWADSRVLDASNPATPAL